MLLLLTLLGLGAVSAYENSTDLSLPDDAGDLKGTSQDMEILIEDALNGDEIDLDEKTYGFAAKDETKEVHILIDKSLTFNGVENRTVIDGNNTVVYFDTPKAKTPKGEIVISGFWKDGYVVKNTGKKIVFNNITFINLNLTTWHEMEFKNCRFINSQITSYEKNSTFDGCIFNNTRIILSLLIGSQHSHCFNITGSSFCQSFIGTEQVITSTYLAIVGGARFYTLNRFYLTDSDICDSKIILSSNEMSLAKSRLSNSECEFYSCLMKIDSCNLESQRINNLCMSKMYVENSRVNNSQITATGAYFSIGSVIRLKNSTVNNTDISMTPNAFHSTKPEFTSMDSTIENTSISTTETTVSIENTAFNGTRMVLFFTDMAIKNSTFYGYESIKEAIKTKTQKETNGKTVQCLVKTDYRITDSYLINDTGKFLINDKDLKINTLHKIKTSKRKTYTYGDRLKIRLVDYKGKPVAKKKLYVIDLKSYDSYEIKTDKKGVAKFKFRNAGKRSFYIYYTSPGFSFRDVEHGTTIKLKINKAKTTVKAPKVTHKFKKSKYFKVTVKSKATKKPIPKVKIKIKVYTGKKHKTYAVKTDKKGTAKINTKNLKVGKHKVVISSANKNYKISKKSSIKIKK